jgi:hypothetical protein
MRPNEENHMTVRANEALNERSCGLCGSPNCLSHTLESRGICPFDELSEGWDQEERSKAVVSILNANRSSPSVHEITPCSEYSRFTVEGILADPLSPEKNAVFETRSMGALFRASGLREKKWSDPLSYGMALYADDIRVHIQGKGKIIIRRAHDKEEASRLFLDMADLIHPSLYCSIGGHSLADTIREMALCGIDTPGCLPPMLEWPVGSGRTLEGDAVISSCERAFDERGPDVEEALRKVLVSDPTPSGAARASQITNETWSGMESAGYPSREGALGVRTFFIMADRGAEGILRFVKAMEERDEGKEVLLHDARVMLSEGLLGRECPLDLKEMSMEDRSALRNVWRSVTSVRH